MSAAATSPRSRRKAVQTTQERLQIGGERVPELVSHWLKTTLVTAVWAAVRVKKALLAVAASMLTAAYHMLRDGTEYHDLDNGFFAVRHGQSDVGASAGSEHACPRCVRSLKNGAKEGHQFTGLDRADARSFHIPLDIAAGVGLDEPSTDRECQQVRHQGDFATRSYTGTTLVEARTDTAGADGDRRRLAEHVEQRPGALRVRLTSWKSGCVASSSKAVKPRWTASSCRKPGARIFSSSTSRCWIPSVVISARLCTYARRGCAGVRAAAAPP